MNLNDTIRILEYVTDARDKESIYEINHNKRRGIGSMDAWKTWKEFEVPENEIHALQN